MAKQRKIPVSRRGFIGRHDARSPPARWAFPLIGGAQPAAVKVGMHPSGDRLRRL